MIFQEMIQELKENNSLSFKRSNYHFSVCWPNAQEKCVHHNENQTFLWMDIFSSSGTWVGTKRYIPSVEDLFATDWEKDTRDNDF